MKALDKLKSLIKNQNILKIDISKFNSLNADQILKLTTIVTSLLKITEGKELMNENKIKKLLKLEQYELNEGPEISMALYDFKEITSAVSTKNKIVQINGIDKKNKKAIRELTLKDDKQAKSLVKNINDKLPELNKLIRKGINEMDLNKLSSGLLEHIVRHCEKNKIDEVTEELVESLKGEYKIIVLESEEFKALLAEASKDLTAEELTEDKVLELSESVFENMENGVDFFMEAVLKHDKRLTEDDGYEEFFQKALVKYGVKAPDELEGDKKKEFYDYIDANWKSDKEKEGIEENFLNNASLELSKGNNALAIDEYKKEFMSQLSKHPDYVEMSDDMAFLSEDVE